MNLLIFILLTYYIIILRLFISYILFYFENENNFYSKFTWF